MFAYCNNNPANYCDPHGELLVEAGTYLFVQGVALLTAAIFSATATTIITNSNFSETVSSAISSVIAGVSDLANSIANSFSSAKEDDEAKAKADSINNGALYYGALIAANQLIPVTEPMPYESAIAWATSTAAAKTYGKNRSWGLYTAAQTDAFVMATSLGGAIPPLDNEWHRNRPGEFPHYHVAGFTFFNHYKHFHIWYGQLYTG